MNKCTYFEVFEMFLIRYLPRSCPLYSALSSQVAHERGAWWHCWTDTLFFFLPFSWNPGSHWTIRCSRSSGAPWSARYARRERNWWHPRSQGRQGESRLTLEVVVVSLHHKALWLQWHRMHMTVLSLSHRVTMEQRDPREHLERTVQEWVQNKPSASCYFDSHQTSIHMTCYPPSGSDWPHWASWSFWTQWCQGKNNSNS